MRDSTFAKYSLQRKAILKNIFVCCAPTHQSQFGSEVGISLYFFSNTA